MGKIDVVNEYLPILQDHCIYKVQGIVADTVDEKNAPCVIDGCDVAGQV